jgi:DnaJ-class molecular chaperone
MVARPVAGSQTPDTPETAPPPCSACRGTGRVVSQLGGTPREVPCPWCDGGGRRLREHDAQAHWRTDGPSGGDAA